MKEIPKGMEVCDTCNGKGEVVISCCTGDVVTDDFMMCPQCHEHLGEETCEDCDGKGYVRPEEQVGRTKVDMQMMAEDQYDAWKNGDL